MITIKYYNVRVACVYYIITLLTAYITFILQTVVILRTINNNYFIDVAKFPKYVMTLHKLKVCNTNSRPRVKI